MKAVKASRTLATSHDADFNLEHGELLNRSQTHNIFRFFYFREKDLPKSKLLLNQNASLQTRFPKMRARS